MPPCIVIEGFIIVEPPSEEGIMRAGMLLLLWLPVGGELLRLRLGVRVMTDVVVVGVKEEDLPRREADSMKESVEGSMRWVLKLALCGKCC